MYGDYSNPSRISSSLSTEDILATLSQLMARRGQCNSLYSENGFNFVGANQLLKAHLAQLVNEKKVNDIITMHEKSGIYSLCSPSFWRTLAVQSTKRLLIRVTKDVLLTYDKTTTLLCKIEAALNSQPLYHMSVDPTCFSVLTPGHFLVGGLLTLPPESDVSFVPQNRLRNLN